ncbi:site-specific integrase [Methylobacter sp. BlB1]|uniref:tyrosine-type recombinase/integrase n=1 Tax=unclassified Methylobacter TaxID=2635283 RepID=UPI001895CCD9|nr:site-specific integrase [Methylobacter sp. BlB1]MBF6650081.1 tyrosine-type recombinase/integrase [Methylobacter sp. BlB1]
MAINKISAAKFKNLQPADKDQLISDGDSLFISVRSIKNGGAKSFRMAYRINGKQRWITLKADSLAAARLERDTYKNWLLQGKEPDIERNLEIERQRARQLAEQEALAKLNTRLTVNDLFIRWHDIALANYKERNEIVRMFNKDVLPILGGLFVEDVRKSHITAVTDALLLRGVNRMAKRILGLMRQMFRFAVDRDILETDPTAKIQKSKIGGKDVERDRVLSEDEIRALAEKMPDAGFMKSTECAIWIALSTLCRVGELSKARYNDINFEQRIWNIPEYNSKNGKAHFIYLSDFALAQFKLLRSLRTQDVWLFPNHDGISHVSEKSISKQLGSRQSVTILTNRSKNNQALVMPGGKWTMHDLRRTGATLMSAMGISPDVIEKCLNHTEENRMKRIYQRYDMKAEQRNAWQLLGDKLNELTLQKQTIEDDSLSSFFSKIDMSTLIRAHR